MSGTEIYDVQISTALGKFFATHSLVLGLYILFQNIFLNQILIWPELIGRCFDRSLNQYLPNESSISVCSAGRALSQGKQNYFFAL